VHLFALMLAWRAKVHSKPLALHTTTFVCTVVAQAGQAHLEPPHIAPRTLFAACAPLRVCSPCRTRARQAPMATHAALPYHGVHTHTACEWQRTNNAGTCALPEHLISYAPAPLLLCSVDLGLQLMFNAGAGDMCLSPGTGGALTSTPAAVCSSAWDFFWVASKKAWKVRGRWLEALAANRT
jgi:hypothetical protein